MIEPKHKNYVTRKSDKFKESYLLWPQTLNDIHQNLSSNMKMAFRLYLIALVFCTVSCNSNVSSNQEQEQTPSNIDSVKEAEKAAKERINNDLNDLNSTFALIFIHDKQMYIHFDESGITAQFDFQPEQETPRKTLLWCDITAIESRREHGLDYIVLSAYANNFKIDKAFQGYSEQEQIRKMKEIIRSKCHKELTR